VILVLQSDLTAWMAKQVYWLGGAEWKRIEALLPQGCKGASSTVPWTAPAQNFLRLLIPCLERPIRFEGALLGRLA